MRQHDGQGLRTALVVIAASVLLVLWSWGAATGPGGLLEDGSPERATPVGAGPPETAGPGGTEPSPTPSPSSSPSPGPTSTPFAVAVAPWLVLAAGCVALCFMVVVLRRMSPDRWRVPVRERDRTPVASLSADERAAIQERLAAQAEAGLGQLVAGSPRAAIIACWEAFEQAAARAGGPRQTWETSSELVVRLLGEDGGDASAAVLLAGLYREARFSDHPVSEEMRDEAVALLRRIHDGTGTRGRR